MTALFFCPENERMCGADLHRGESADRGIPHLPRAIANELTEVGVPAAPTPVRRDTTSLLCDPDYEAARRARRIRDVSGWYQRNSNRKGAA